MARVSTLWRNDKLYSECRFHGEIDPIIDNIYFNSNECGTRSLFVALEGIHVDGHSFIEQAINSGSCAIIHSKELSFYHPEVLYIQHPNGRKIASHLGYKLYGPLPQNIIGITGTDGKSTTAEFLYQILKRINVKCALLTTVSYDTGLKKESSPFKQSTPESNQLYQFLHNCYLNGIDTVILETTSHALSESGSRVADLEFSGSIFTTISSDHLDFHKTKENYIDAKLNLARQLKEGAFVVMEESFAYKDEVLKSIKSSVKPFYYSLDKNQSNANLEATTLFNSFTEQTLLCNLTKVKLNYGQNIYAKNFLAAVSCAIAMTKLKPLYILKNANSLKKIEGRFKIINKENFPTIVIDFAHTPDAFKNILTHTRKFFPATKIVALFGAAAERDHSKRPTLGYLASLYCDTIILTNEDPRFENQKEILDDLKSEIKNDVNIYCIYDRFEAIEFALKVATKEDVVLLLAKGHEKFIDFGSYRKEWDEENVVLNLLTQMGKNNG